MRARDKQTASEIVGCGRFIVYDSTQENLGRGGGGGGGGGGVAATLSPCTSES